jgi:HSP20 family molecular chaperone IbpA
MPANIDANSVKASMNKGVLKVVIAKPKSAVAQKIEIKHAV